MTLRHLLLILHFLGLAMGFSVSFANMVIGAIAAKATPSDRAVLGRVPPAMTRIGDAGLMVLWVTGVTMLFAYWGGVQGFSALPWAFHVKIAGVVVLTGLVGYIHSLMRKARGGDAAAAARIQVVGKLTFATAVLIVVMAVIAFE